MSKGPDFNKPGIKVRKGFYILFKIMFSFNSAAYYVLWLKFLQIVLLPVDYLFLWIEKLTKETKSDSNIPILFVVGIQRTGSTLVSQFIEKTFSFFPIGNFNSIFKRSQFFVHCWFSKARKKPNKSYKNYYGISKGIFSIGDCYEVWDKWLGKNHYVIPNDISEEKINHFKKYFSNLHSTYNKPILTKNNRNSLLLPVFNSTFKNAFFIVVKRDPVAVIKSTLKASKDFFGSEDLLWGLYPNNEFDTDHYENIIEAATVQFLMLDKLLDGQIKTLDKSSYLIIDYDDFCSNPLQFQNELIEKLKNKQGFDIGNAVLKEKSFKSSKRLNKIQIDNQIEEYLVKWKDKI
ncbi:sulfotransferase [Bacteroidota bacterium]